MGTFPMPAFLKLQWLKILLHAHFALRNRALQYATRLRRPKLSPDYGAQLFFLEHIHPGDRVLDIGCNAGELTAFLSEKAGHIDAFDINPGAVLQAKKRMLRNVSFFVGNAELALARAKGRYQCTVLGAVLTFIPNPVVFLKQLAPLTDKVLIRETKFDNDILALTAKDLNVRKSRWKEFSKKEIVDLITASGYRITEEIDTYDMFFCIRPESRT